jgi:hypothetical protein
MRTDSRGPRLELARTALRFWRDYLTRVLSNAHAQPEMP